MQNVFQFPEPHRPPPVYVRSAACPAPSCSDSDASSTASTSPRLDYAPIRRPSPSYQPLTPPASPPAYFPSGSQLYTAATYLVNLESPSDAGSDPDHRLAKRRRLDDPQGPPHLRRRLDRKLKLKGPSSPSTSSVLSTPATLPLKIKLRVPSHMRTPPPQEATFTQPTQEAFPEELEDDVYVYSSPPPSPILSSSASISSDEEQEPWFDFALDASLNHSNASWPALFDFDPFFAPREPKPSSLRTTCSLQDLDLSLPSQRKPTGLPYRHPRSDPIKRIPHIEGGDTPPPMYLTEEEIEALHAFNATKEMLLAAAKRKRVEAGLEKPEVKKVLVPYSAEWMDEMDIACPWT